jgi:DNA-directed RNA polymerase specialized sigma24 family protein
MPNSLTSESLKKLLAALSQDEAEAARLYTNLRTALFRYFEIKGITDETEAADETLDRVAEKITQGATIEDIRNFTFGVAKYVALESVRREQYHARAVDSFYLKNSASDEFGKTDAVEHLRECFNSLYPRERELLLKYFVDMPAEKLFEYRQKLAETEKLDLNALRNRVSRLRRRLEECLGKRK